jgi:hypothetical protein
LTGPRRLLTVAAALLGLVLTGFGAWLAATIGPSGTLAFRATTSNPLLLPAEVINRVDDPVTVTVEGSGAEQVWLGVAPVADVLAVVGNAAHDEARSAQFPARTLELATSGAGLLPDPRTLDVWRQTVANTKSVSAVVDQDRAPEAILVLPNSGEQVTATVEFTHRGWFYQALTVLIVGLIIASFALGWLVTQRNQEREEEQV